MQLLKLSKPKANLAFGSAKAQINIKGVQGEVLILTDKSFCSIIETSSINFELKGEAEQDAIIETYQSFLNSLGFPLQIIIRVREIDLDHYLDGLDAQSKQEDQAIYRNQLIGYATFVRSLVSVNRILSHNFYVIIPLEVPTRHDFEFVREQLALRTEIVEKGIIRLGMNSRLLKGLEILNLFYVFYNPRQAKTQPLADTAMRILHSVIQKGDNDAH